MTVQREVMKLNKKFVEQKENSKGISGNPDLCSEIS